MYKYKLPIIIVVYKNGNYNTKTSKKEVRVTCMRFLFCGWVTSLGVRMAMWMCGISNLKKNDVNLQEGENVPAQRTNELKTEHNEPVTAFVNRWWTLSVDI